MQTENNIDLQESTAAASRFLERFGIVKLLGECGVYKEKGVPVCVILLYIFNLMFSPMSMYCQIKMGAFHEDFSKNTVYRFLGNVHMNWHRFRLRLSAVIIRHVAGLTEDKDNRYALLVDDTPLPKCGKAMELVSKYFNHVTMGYEFGYRVLTLAWTDGVTTVPVRYSLLASAYDETVRGKIRDDIDGRNCPKTLLEIADVKKLTHFGTAIQDKCKKSTPLLNTTFVKSGITFLRFEFSDSLGRSLGGRIRKMARTSMNDLAVRFACDAVKSGIPASIIALPKGRNGSAS